VIDQQHAARFDATLKVTNRLFLLTLIAKVVHHVGKRITHTNDRIETLANQMVDVIV
jgi:hypothetical protein